MKFQDFEAETSKLGRLRRRFVYAALTRLVQRHDRFTGKIFAQDGPIGFGVAVNVVAADELEFGRRPLLYESKSSGLRPERDPGRGESMRPKIVPNEMRQRLFSRIPTLLDL